MTTLTPFNAIYVFSDSTITRSATTNAQALRLVLLTAAVVLLIQLVALSAYGQGRSMPKIARTADAAPVGLSAGQGSVAPNADVVVPLMITDTTGKNIIAYQFNLVYDPSVLVVTADPATTAGTISSEMAFAVNPFTPGILRVAVYGAYPLSGQGV
ncbi:MAG: cohesin domain-containing protein, partial [Pyrinomonadaceae bacterium]